MTLFPRASGILLHPTSLPGQYGIGDLGEYAYRFVDYLVDTGQSLWQILPLGPTSYGDSPYQCLSAFAGNTNLISLDKLVEDGWLSGDDLDDSPDFPIHNVDYGPVIEYHDALLDKAYAGFKAKANTTQQATYEAWFGENQAWIEDWGLYIALKESYEGKPWVEWDETHALSDPSALKQARADLAERIEVHYFKQWLFYQQWDALKTYANDKGVRLIGDIPIFVAHDSSDVWANRDRFYLDATGNPTVVAGVPPDYFSPTGQRWGNPLYRWDVMAEQGYSWWISRMQATLKLVDLVRIDHFRAFEDYWEIPADEPTAVKGRWLKGPNVKFFAVLEEALGELPIIAEDLGDITQAVIEMRDALGLPGMKVLQFAWSDPNNPFLPHNHVTNCVVYTGTHDNNTSLGWYVDEASDHHRNMMRDYLGHDIDDPAWTLIRMAMRSSAHTCVVPMQDILDYGADTRMNTPGVQGGNWAWRFTANEFDNPVKERLAHFTWLYRRRADQQTEVYGDAAV